MNVVVGKLISQMEKPRWYVAIGVISALVLLAPADVLLTLGLSSAVNKYRVWIGGASVASLGLILTQILLFASRSAKSGWERRTLLRSFQECVHNLSPEEKVVLGQYIHHSKKTCYFDVSDGVPQGLAAQKILFRSSNLAASNRTFAYNIQPWAWQYLRKRPHLLNVADDV